MIHPHKLEKKWIDYIPNMVKDDKGDYYKKGFRIILFPNDAIPIATIAIADSEYEAKVLVRTLIGTFDSIVETANEIMV